jgi:quercetin dioxygenase-like cupin family protein
VAGFLGVGAVQAQQATLANGAPKLEPIVSLDLSDVGLDGTAAAQRVTIAPLTVTASHTHTGRTSIIIMLQGSIVDVRGTAKKEYTVGDVFTVPEGTTHYAENHGTMPAVYVEINTTKKRP